MYVALQQMHLHPAHGGPESVLSYINACSRRRGHNRPMHAGSARRRNRRRPAPETPGDDAVALYRALVGGLLSQIERQLEACGVAVPPQWVEALRRFRMDLDRMEGNTAQEFALKLPMHRARFMRLRELHRALSDACGVNRHFRDRQSFGSELPNRRRPRGWKRR